MRAWFTEMKSVEASRGFKPTLVFRHGEVLIRIHGDTWPGRVRLSRGETVLSVLPASSKVSVEGIGCEGMPHASKEARNCAVT